MPKLTKAQQQERQEAIDRLRAWIKPGDTVFCILRSRARSGMSRTIDLVKIENNEVSHLGWNAATALGWRYDRKAEGIKISGCGMDMGFHIVYELSSALFPDWKGERGQGSGYALTHRWL